MTNRSTTEAATAADPVTHDEYLRSVAIPKPRPRRERPNLTGGGGAEAAQQELYAAMAILDLIHLCGATAEPASNELETIGNAAAVALAHVEMASELLAGPGAAGVHGAPAKA